MQTIVLPRCEEGRDLTKIVAFLSALPRTKPWRIRIDEVKSQRSINQNRYLWLLYGIIIKDGGEAMAGWRPEELHEFFLIEHFGHEVREMFGRKKLVPLNRSSKLSTVEFSDFVAHIQQFMAERGVYLPDPDQFWNVEI